MLIEKAISRRILDLCSERDITINKLATMSLITQSTLDNIVNCKSKNPKILTIARICEGLNISISEFFHDKLFKDVNLKI